MAVSVHLLDSITDISDRHRDGVAISGSHGGLYTATVASRGGLRGVIFNDAGGGLDGAGTAGVLALDDVAMAAAAADCRSCLIGSADDTRRHGGISTVNATAGSLGIAPGQSVGEAVDLLAGAAPPSARLAPVREARATVTLATGLVVALLDSASLVGPGDAGGVLVTGSHGGLVGGDPARALRAPARVAVFNDAGIGKDGIGTTRLPALASRGIAAVTVDYRTARIGEARSAFETGAISFANAPAELLGARPGLPLRAWLETDRMREAAAAPW